LLKLVFNPHGQKLTGAQMAHKQLTLEKRYEIKAYMQSGFSKSFIANQLKVHKSTITRELYRNRVRSGYHAKAAHESICNESTVS
jgi:IS30 family transposase